MTTAEPTPLEHEVAQLIIDTLKLEGVTTIAPDTPLFDDGLGLDSIDALELALALQKRYAVTVTSDDQGARHHFANVASLAAFVAANREPCANS